MKATRFVPLAVLACWLATTGALVWAKEQPSVSSRRAVPVLAMNQRLPVQSAVLTDEAPAAERASLVARSRASKAHAKPAVRKIQMEVTAYCPCRICCDYWADIPMAYRRVGGGRTRLLPLIRRNVGFVAGPAWLPMGSWVSVPGYHGGKPVQVLDRGGGIRGNHVDVFVTNHDRARQWGKRMTTVTLYGKG